ncbi:MAG: LuxR C-terminal-related transcriptional regulator [Pseudomonadales bacterium]|nr:LuxR C-terminal-related transcriptional regulator [Pseudomonadales bacterium]
MVNLQTQDLKDIIEVSRRALECNSMETLQKETLTLMERSLGARSSVYAQITKNQKEIQLTEGAEHGVPKGAMARWCSEYHSSDPFMHRYLNKLSTQPSNVIVSSEVISHKEYVSTSFYNEFMKPQSIYHVMIIGLKSDDNKPVGVYGLHRSRHAPAFSAREIAKANMLAPHLKGAFQRVMAQEMLHEIRWITEFFSDNVAKDGIAVLDEKMNPVFMSQKAREILGENGSLSDSFLRSCVQCLNSQPDFIDQPISFKFFHKGRPLRVELNSVTNHQRRHQRFIVRLDATLENMQESPVLLDRMRALGLSRREIDVAQLLALGLTSLSIADKLCISVRTVNNHLRSIYEKVGVHNRTSLIYHLSTEHRQ